MRIVTWNINSLRLRLPLLAELDRQLRPDVICLQETKVPDPLFPHEALKELGYPHQVRRGMKGYNGVAILARQALEPVLDTPDWCEKGDCRHAAARIEGEDGPVEIHNFYVPAGGDIPDEDENPKYAHKLAFVDQVTAWFETHHLARTVIVGDLNIAPLENDVWSHKQLLKVVSHTPPETTRLNAWLNTGFVDAMRHFIPSDEKLYTWWSYRNRDWSASNRGRRLDHVWITPDLVASLHGMQVIRETRDWASPSDHVPVMINLGA
ncbi:exodeoxyribonuclease III [Acetobacter estunensis NRIC 0472]|uniref:Exodeoxyribonuclease III n=1 Tax=Acetobacter estunensis TaxID=104097 RepID=A0A967EJ49_9PROT|nr:exodeoxyribonuclease III [Acetobacter estunensis]NHO54354.1 exodeoxyribonuclease III [Acetobacter estunensis]GBQ21859.1 exodeoxyribonuclease III [Acetobacter estunensis NRIC 0472]